MMNLVTTVGVSGSVIQEPRPMILFRDGSACRDMNFVVSGIDKTAHQAKYPNAWLKWKLAGGKYALQNGNDWKPLYFQIKYPPHDRDFTLQAKFTNISGATIVDVTAFSQKVVHLSDDHRIVAGNYAAVTSPANVTQVAPPDKRGTYQVDGYTIEFKWDDGTITKTSFVYSEEDADAIYLSGVCFFK